MGRPRRRQHRRIPRHRRPLRRRSRPLDRPRQDRPLLLHRLRRPRLRGLLVLAWTRPRRPPQGLFLWQKFPKFILGFIAISVLATCRLLHPRASSPASRTSRAGPSFLPSPALACAQTSAISPARAGGLSSSAYSAKSSSPSSLSALSIWSYTTEEHRSRE